MNRGYLHDNSNHHQLGGYEGLGGSANPASGEELPMQERLRYVEEHLFNGRNVKILNRKKKGSKAEENGESEDVQVSRL